MQIDSWTLYFVLFCDIFEFGAELAEYRERALIYSDHF